jgi:hypothetical protein
LYLSAGSNLSNTFKDSNACDVLIVALKKLQENGPGYFLPFGKWNLPYLNFICLKEQTH